MVKYIYKIFMIISFMIFSLSEISARSYYDEYDYLGRKRVPTVYQNRYKKERMKNENRQKPVPPPKPVYYYTRNGAFYTPMNENAVWFETDKDEYTKYQINNNGTFNKKNKVKVHRQKNGRTTKVWKKMPKKFKPRKK